jgi:protein-S-isoprenylcysteine O-methyltransferase Ste14
MTREHRPTFSGTTFAGWYFVFQAVAIAAWWLYLSLVPAARQFFVPTGAGEVELIAFAAPDLLVAVPASLAAGIAVLFSLRWALPLSWVSAGAVNYAFVYCVAWSMLREGGWLNVAMMGPAALFATISALDISSGAIQIFRRAVPAAPARHVAATVAQILVFWSFFLFVVPVAIAFVESQLGWPRFAITAQRAVAGVTFLAFSSLGLASGFTMASRGRGTPLPFVATNRLVTTGPYAYVRNPMVVAGLGQGASVGLWTGSWAVLAYVIVGGLIWQLLVRPAEERDLQQVFGSEFIEYCRQVRCWVPRGRQS